MSEFVKMREIARAQWLALDKTLAMMLEQDDKQGNEAFACPGCGADEDQLEETGDVNNPGRYTCLKCGQSFRLKEQEDG